MKTILNLSFKTIQKDSQKVVKIDKKMDIQSKYSGPSPTSVNCQKDSGSTGENGTQVKPVLLAVKIFAVWFKKLS